jgi:hypothetical protein
MRGEKLERLDEGARCGVVRRAELMLHPDEAREVEPYGLRVDPGDNHYSAGAQDAEAVVQRSGRTRGLNETIHFAVFAESRGRGLAEGGGREVRNVRDADRRSGLEADGVVQTREQDAAAAELGDPGGEEADRPRTKHHDANIGRYLSNVDRVNRDGQRLRECGDLQGEALRNWKTIPRGDPDKCGHRAIAMKTDNAPVHAILRPIGAAGGAATADDGRPANDTVAHVQSLDAGADSDDPARELVAERHRHSVPHEAVPGGPFVGMKIAAADAGGGDRHDDLRRVGLVRWLDLDEVGAIDRGGLAQRQHFAPVSRPRHPQAEAGPAADSRL